MIMVGAFFSWWYGLGLNVQMRSISNRYVRWVDYFSFAMLVRTLFAPFRQIAAGKVGGSFDVKFHVWLDRLVSRCVGAVVRILTLCAGAVFMVFVTLYSALQFAIWLLLPALPVVVTALFIMKWMPWIR